MKSKPNSVDQMDGDELFRRSFEDAGIGMTIIDPDGTIRRANQAFCEIIGYTADEICDNRMLDYTHPDDRETSRLSRQTAIVTQDKIEGLEKRYIRKDGATIWGLLHRSIIRSPDGELLYTIGQIQDITDQKRIEFRLQESEARLRDYVTAAADRYWETDIEHRFVYVSDINDETNRFDPQEMIGRTRGELDEVAPDAPHWNEYRALLEKREPFKNFEYVRHRPDGSSFFIRTSALPIFDDLGEFRGFRGVNQELSVELTEKILAEEKAITAQQRLFDAMEQLDVGFVLWDEELRLVHCNTFFRELQGENKQYLTPGISYRDYLQEVSKISLRGRSDEEKSLWWQARMAAVEDFSEDVEYQIPDGRWYRARRRRLLDRSVIGLHTDITNRKNVDQMKDEFVSIASHELRTPLTSIVGAIGLVKSGATGELPEKAQELIEIAHLNSERLVALVNDFLDLNKMESGEIELDQQPIDVMKLLAESIKLNGTFAKKFGCTYDISKGVDSAMVLGDEQYLHQVMTNLLSNAAKFSDPDGQIHISAARQNSQIRISVTDRGRGIAPGFRDKIFDRFTQVDSSDTRTMDGTGLGLSIAKKIIDLHGGKIDFRSEFGKGSTFFFDLPELTAPS